MQVRGLPLQRSAVRGNISKLYQDAAMTKCVMDPIIKV